jgi:ankyrin repeat protein
MSVIKSAQRKSLSGIIKAIEKGANINEISHDGKNALHYAVKARCSQIVKFLVENGININIKDNDGKTALYYTIEYYNSSNNHNKEMFKNMMLYLVENGAKDELLTYNYKDEYEKYKNAKNLNQDKPLLVTPFNQSKNSILKFSHHRSFKKLKESVRKGANINEINSLGKNALFHAVSVNRIDRVNIVKYLIEKGINLNLKDKDGKTALMHCNDPKINKILIDNGVNINEVDNKGKNALFYRNDPETVKHLIDNGINVNLKDKDGKTALTFCSDAKTIKILLENGAKPNLQNIYRRMSSLMFQDGLDALKTLLEYGANPNLQCANGSTVLSICFDNYKKFSHVTSYFDIVLKLLECGADIDLVQNDEAKNALKKIYDENIVSIRLKKAKERSDVLREELIAKYYAPENIEKWGVAYDKPFDEIQEIM